MGIVLLHFYRTYNRNNSSLCQQTTCKPVSVFLCSLCKHSFQRPLHNLGMVMRGVLQRDSAMLQQHRHKQFSIKHHRLPDQVLYGWGDCCYATSYDGECHRCKLEHQRSEQGSAGMMFIKCHVYQRKSTANNTSRSIIWYRKADVYLTDDFWIWWTHNRQKVCSNIMI